MKLLVCIILFSVSVHHDARALDLEYVRAQYERAAVDKTVCAWIIDRLSQNTESFVHLAYLGAYQAIWANHTQNVIQKLNTFNKGKKNIERAIRMHGDNVEIRMIRLSIQKNCPSILGYNQDIVHDQQYVEKHKHTVTSLALSKLIMKILGE